MAIAIKSNDQIEKMRVAGKIVANLHELLSKHISPGITTKELDDIASEYFKSQGAIASFKGYKGYPASICVSINEEVIHGIPGARKLTEGDIVSIDVGAYISGFHGDAARTYGVGNVTDETLRLINVTKQSYFAGIEFAKTGRHLHEISAAIQNYAESNGFSVVRDFVGHGIGRLMHEEPQIPNYKPRGGRGPKLTPGMALAIEPMVNAGTHEIIILDDEWTVVTKDGKYSAHYENTLIITDGEPEIMTML